MAMLVVSDLMLVGVKEKDNLFVSAEALDGRIRCGSSVVRAGAVATELRISQVFPVGCTVTIKVCKTKTVSAKDSVLGQCTTQVLPGLSAVLRLAKEKKDMETVLGSVAVRVLTGTDMAFPEEATPASQPRPPKPECPPPPPPHLRERRLVRILSIDGGGVRGIIPTVFIAALEAKAGKPAHELFDVIAGTSTGGLVSVALTHNRNPQGAPANPISASEMLQTYAMHSQTIFPQIASGNPVREAIREIASESRRLAPVIESMAANAASIQSLKEIKGPRYDRKGLDKVLNIVIKPNDSPLSTALVPTLVTTYDLKRQTPVFFKSWVHSVSKIFALQCTTAAPTYFAPPQPSATTAGEFSGSVFIDGGVGTNNPSLAAYLAAKNELYSDPGHEYVVVSLGTGILRSDEKPKPKEEITPAIVAGWGVAHWLMPQHGDLVNLLLDVGAETAERHMKEILGQRYYRFQHELANASIEMDNCFDKNISELMNEGALFVQRNADDIESLVSVLSRP